MSQSFIKICNHCGKEFQVKSSIFNKRHNCSRECHYASRNKKMPPLTDRQLQIVEGCLLGDAHLEKPQKESHNSRFRKGQKTFNRDYQKSLFLELNPYSKTLKDYDKKRTWANKSGSFTETENVFYTCSHSIFTEMRNNWYKNNVKILPSNLKLSSISLAYWFCDDGSSNTKSNNARFCTHNFSLNEVEKLCEMIFTQFNLKCHPVKDRIGANSLPQYIIYVGSENYDNLLEIVTPHIPWKCMSHKLEHTRKKWKWKTKELSE